MIINFSRNAMERIWKNDLDGATKNATGPSCWMYNTMLASISVVLARPFVLLNGHTENVENFFGNILCKMDDIPAIQNPLIINMMPVHFMGVHDFYYY